MVISANTIKIYLETKESINSLTLFKDFIIPFAAVFIGSWLAYYFNIKNYDNESKNQEIENIQYAIANVSANINELYEMKKKFIVPRLTECENLEKIIEKFNAGEINPGTYKLENNLANIFNLIVSVDPKFINNLQQYSFLSKKDTNIITAIFTYQNLLKQLEIIIPKLNNHIQLHGVERVFKLDIGYFQLLTSLTRILETALDDCIAYAHLISEVLIKFANENLNIKLETKFDQSYKEFRPDIKTDYDFLKEIPSNKKNNLKNIIINKVQIQLKKIRSLYKGI